MPDEIDLEQFEEKVRERYSIPQGLWRSISEQESGGNVNAISPTNVRGKWQVTRKTAAQYGLDTSDPFHQAAAAAKYLREGYDKYADLKDDNERWLAAAGHYYGGPDAVKSDGTLSTSSKDNLSTPADYVTSIAQRWKAYNDAQPASTPKPSSAVTPKPAQVLTGMAATIATLHPKSGRPPTAKERKLAADETARQKATPQIARMVEDFEALKREGSVDAARSVAQKIKAQYGRWMEVGEGDGWPYVKSKVQGWNPIQPTGAISTPSLEDQQARFAQRPILDQLSERGLDALARGGGQVSRMLRQTAGAGLGLAQGLAGGDFRPVDLPAWRQGEEERFRELEERRLRRPSSFVSDVAEGTIEALPAAAAAIGGTVLTGGGLPAAAAMGAGMGAAGADWRDPKRAATQTVLGATAPIVGGQVGSKIGGAIAKRLAGPASQAVARAGGELVGGGLGNVIGSGAEQLGFEGRVDPRELAKQGIIGAALNVPGAAGAARRPATMPLSGLNRATVEPNIVAPTQRAQFRRPTNPVDQVIADFGNRLAEIDQMVPLAERPAAIEAARRDFNARRRQAALIPQKPAAEPLATPAENIPENIPRTVAKPAENIRATPQLPEGVRIVREGEPVPPVQRGQRQIPMEFENPDGTAETVRVIVDGRVDEATLRPMIEQALRTQEQPAAQPSSVAQPEATSPKPPPVQPVAPRRQPAPIQFTQLGPEGLRGGIPLRKSSLPSQKLLGPGRPEDVPTERLATRPQPERVPTEPLTEEIPTQRDAPPTRPFEYADAPETQKMPALSKYTVEDAPTRELPAVMGQRRTADLPVAPLARRTGTLPRQEQAQIPIRRTAESPQPEPTNRIVEGAGDELPRRALRPREGQPVEMSTPRRMPPPLQRPAGRPQRPLQGRMYPEFPADRRAMVGEGRRVGAEVQAGRGEKGQFGKIAQQMFKSTSGQAPHGQDAFFHDPAVKGALGLSRDAEMGEVRAELKKELARSMGVKADEISLTQVGPDIWKRWARQKRLSADALAKMNTAIERYQKGVISDIEKTAPAQAEQPSKRVEGVPGMAPETGRKIQHSKFGTVTEAPDQSSVRKGFMRVTDESGKSHIIRNPRRAGNREAAFVKTEKAEGPDIVQRMAKLLRTPSSPVEIAKLRAEFPDVSKADFDAEMIKLNEEGRIALHRHDQPASLSEAKRAEMVKIGNDYFTAATIRPREGTVMGFGPGGLQGMFKGRKAPKANPTKADIESASIGKSIGNIFRTGSQAIRTVKTAFDLSAPFGQGAFLTIPHPLKAAKAFDKMLRSVNQTQSDAIDMEIAFHPLRRLMEKSDLHVATLEKIKGRAGEEAFMLQALNKVPGIGASERTYRTYLDVLRISVFEGYVKSLQNDGYTFENNPKAFKDAAAAINIASGRGSIKKGGKIEKAMDLAGDILFAPRNLISKFQMLDPVRYASLAPGARKLVWRDAMVNLGVILGTGALLRANGFSVSFNAESDEFLTARLGNTRYDLTFGAKTQVQFLARMAMGAYRKSTGEGNLPGKDPLSIAKNFARNKLAPGPGLAIDAFKGADFKGEKFADKSKTQIALETVAPMIVEGFYEGYKDEGLKGAAKVVGPSFLGARVNTYPDRAKVAFLDVPPEVRAEQKAAGKTRPFLTPKKAQSRDEKDETPSQFEDRKALANEWNAKYGRQLVGSEIYRESSKEEKAAALDYLKEQINKQTGQKRPSLWLLAPGHIFETVRESERKKRVKAAQDTDGT